MTIERRRYRAKPNRYRPQKAGLEEAFEPPRKTGRTHWPEFLSVRFEMR